MEQTSSAAYPNILVVDYVKKARVASPQLLLKSEQYLSVGYQKLLTFERPGGGICGPVFMAAADVAIWFAVATLRGTRERWVTADLKTAFLRAARHEPFTCTARVLRIGRHLAYVVAECARQDGNPLTHHTAIYVRTPTGAPQRRRANVER